MQQFVDSASSSSIVLGCKLIKTQLLPNSQIIDTINPLLGNPGSVVKSHFLHSQISQDYINSYMAASVLLHSVDAWAYLSNSIDCLLLGNVGTATHLAYYAELRSAMSFLASEGIGVFNHDHLNIDRHNASNKNPIAYELDRYGRRKFRNGRPVVKGAGTHQFAWDCIEAWTKSSIKPQNNNLLRVFSVNGKTFEDWLTKFPYSSQTRGRLILQGWLSKWNADVRFFRNDRDARNKVSYNPQRLTSPSNKYTINEIIDKLGSFWELVEPYTTNKFQLLDKYLLRLFLWELYQSLSANIRSSNTFEALLIQTLNDLKLSHDSSLIAFLKDPSPISHPLFVEAGSPVIDLNSRTINALPVIARATLMLRISTGSMNAIYSEAGISKQELDFMWERLGVEFGFWEAGAQPSDFNQLWDDIRDDIDDFSSFARSKSPNLQLSAILKDQSILGALNSFKQFHRVALWGIAI